MMNFSKQNRKESGFSLVVCLITITLITVMAVGFFASAAADRDSSKALLNRVRAEMAAETAVQKAMSLVAETIQRYPDSATAWEPIHMADGKPKVEGTVLYFYDANAGSTRLSPSDPAAKRFALPLLSRGLEDETEPESPGNPMRGAVPFETRKAELQAEEWTDENSIDLNRPRFDGDEEGWIGRSIARTQPLISGDVLDARPPARAKWIDIKGDEVNGVSKTVARYAYWIEDESFRLNLNHLGDKARSTELVSPGTNVTEVPYQGLLRFAENQPPPPTPGDKIEEEKQERRRQDIATKALALRKGFTNESLLEPRFFNFLPDPDIKLAENTRFLSTIYSTGLNISRIGAQRLNLNGLGLEKASSFETDIDRQVGQIVNAIRVNAPKFGERFYRTSTAVNPTTLNTEVVSSAHRNIYLHKVAANLRDYVDADLVPTVILKPGKSAPIIAPQYAFNQGIEGAENQVWAQGKDGAPVLQEAVVRYRSKVTGSEFELKVDYYLEFWNMTNRDISAADLGPLPYCKIAFQLPWETNRSQILKDYDNHLLDDSQRRELVIDILTGVIQRGVEVPGGVQFKAGECTVITTDPDSGTVKQLLDGRSPDFSGGLNHANVYYCSILSGSSPKRVYRGPMPSGATQIRPIFRSGGGQDYETEVLMGCSNGYLESNSAPFAHGGGAKTTGSTPRDDWYGGTLWGNTSTPSQLADPRTNNESLTFTRFNGSTGEPDQVRYFNTVSPPRFTLGHPNDLYCNPHANYMWPDYYRGWDQTGTGNPTNPNGDSAPALVASRLISSIGEIGNVFEPARVKGTVGTLGVEGSRGGGRSFRIGQPDDRLDTTVANAPSRQWASWRLCDMFTTTSAVELPAQININGIRRDNGAALRAACEGMSIFKTTRRKLGPSAKTTLEKGDQKLTDEGIKNFIKHAMLRMRHMDADGIRYKFASPDYGPFSERGEISQLKLWNAGTEVHLNINMDEAFDRTREEMVRRLIGFTTTRGNVFSVYVVGQSISETLPPQSLSSTSATPVARTKRVTGTHRTKITFALVPKQADGSPFGVEQETFNPADTAEVTKRFSAPAYYDIKVLHVSH